MHESGTNGKKGSPTAKSVKWENIHRTTLHMTNSKTNWIGSTQCGVADSFH
jgi:hypothetical protein